MFFHPGDGFEIYMDGTVEPEASTGPIHEIVCLPINSHFRLTSCFNIFRNETF